MPKSKTQAAKIPKAELEALHDSLQTKRQQVVALYRHDLQAGQESTDDNADDFADRANNSYSRETLFALSTSERDMLFNIDEALERHEKGTFGTCVHCGNAIGLERLKAVPWARHCIECQELQEKGLLE